MTAERSLATVLFTDIVGSTERAAQLGDESWRHLLERHHALVRRWLRRFGGREVKTAGDGFLVLFESPARALACADAIRNAVRELDLEVRCGLHIGEVEAKDGDVGGLAVHIGSRVAALAGPGEVLVSSTICDAEAGSGFRFEERGRHELKGVPGTWGSPSRSMNSWVIWITIHEITAKTRSAWISRELRTPHKQSLRQA